MSVQDDVRERVKDLLLEHQGKDDAITSREINDEVDLDSIGSFPSTRAFATSSWRTRSQLLAEARDTT